MTTKSITEADRLALCLEQAEARVTLLEGLIVALSNEDTLNDVQKRLLESILADYNLTDHS